MIKTFLLSGHRMGIKIDKDASAVEQNSYATKIANVSNVYNLDALPRNPNNHSKFKNCLFSGTNKVKNGDKEK